MWRILDKSPLAYHMRPVEMGTGLHVLVPTYKFGRCTVWHFQGDGGLADPVGSSTAVVVHKKSFSIMVGVVRRIGYAASKRTANVLSLTSKEENDEDKMVVLFCEFRGGVFESSVLGGDAI